MSVDIDLTAPNVTITTPPEGVVYLAGSTVLADFAATDTGSDIASLVGDVADGAAIDTSVGLHTFTVTATDNAGNVTEVIHNYEAQNYVFGGWQAPLTLNSKDFKKNSTIPVKVTLTLDSVPYCTSETTAQLYVDDIPAVASGNSNTSNYFRCDPVAGQYIFNLSTKMPQLTVGTHTLKVVFGGLGAPADQSIVIKIK